MIHFLWRWAGFLGIQPHLENCAACGKSVAEDNALWFSAREDAIFCSACVSANCAGSSAAGQQSLLQLNNGCRRWLSAVGTLSAAQIHRYSMDNKSFNEAKALTTAVLTGAIGKRLNSWDW